MPADYYVMGRDLVAVADAIRKKGVIVGKIQFPDGFIQAINNIQTGGGGVNPRKWTIDDFAVSGGDMEYIYTIKPELRQFFIVGDAFYIYISNVESGSLDWDNYNTIPPGLVISDTGIYGNLEGGVDLTDVMNVSDPVFDTSYKFRTNSGRNIPIKNP